MFNLPSLSIRVCCVYLFAAMGVTNLLVAEEKYEDFSWVSPNGWEGAVFDVPTWFAKNMQYTGREVIRFHDGFYDDESAGYWTYAFALLVKQTQVPTTQALIDETRRYFTGLSRGLGENRNENYSADKILMKATTDWLISDEGKRRHQIFELQSFDPFTTGSPVKLYVKITTWLCSDSYRAIHYAISPQSLSHDLWKALDKEVDALKCG